MTQPESSHSLPQDDGEGARRPERRGFLIALAGGIGFFATAGPALGKSLLLRSAAAPWQVGTPTQTVTASWRRIVTNSVAGTIPDTLTYTGKSATPPSPGTYTETKPPASGGANSYTSTYPATGGQTQTITIAWTESFSVSPPGTNYHTVSWEGSYYTITSSRTPTWASLTQTITYSATYVTTATKGNDMDGVLRVPKRPIALPPEDGQFDLCIDTIDDPDGDPRLPVSRRNTARLIRFVHGVAS